MDNIKWTPTSKKTPYVNDEVIISTIYNTVCLATYRYYPGGCYHYYPGDYWSSPYYYYDTKCSNYDIKNNIHRLSGCFKEDEIVAWMLAPKPYKTIKKE